MIGVIIYFIASIAIPAVGFWWLFPEPPWSIMLSMLTTAILLLIGMTVLP